MSKLPDALNSLLSELERFGEDNDHGDTKRESKMLNITRDTGEFLAALIRATGARNILEVGASNGYSTLWLAFATQPLGGSITTLERSAAKVAMARENYERAGLQGLITLVEGDAGDFLSTADSGSTDLIFLDSNRADYLAWWPHLKRILRPGGTLVVDNATSHPEEVAGFVAVVNADEAFTTALVPVGKGEFLAVKAG